MPVFSLSEVRTNQIKNYANTFEEQVVSNYGYIVAGVSGSSDSKILRLDLATETNIDTNQNITFNGNFGCNTPGTSDYGFMFCGSNPSAPGTVTTIHRISYTNETVTISPAQTSFPLYLFSVGQNPQYAWNIAGFRDPPGGTCLVDRLDFSTESMAASTPFPSGRLYHYGFNSPSHHYFTGGEYSLPGRSGTSDVNRLQFSNETFDTLTANNAVNSAQSGGTFADSSAGFGYYYGGVTNPPTTVENALTKFDFSTDNAITETSLPVASYGTASAESEFFGYSIGGLTNPYPTATSNVQRYNFSEDTWSFAQSLPATRYACFGQSLIGGSKITRGTPEYTNWKEYASYGYFGGGYGYTGGSYGSRTDFDRLDLSTETTSMLSAVAKNARRSTSSVTDGSKAFISGEDSGADILYSESDTISFNGVRGTVNNTERNSNNFQNYNGTYGYINGGGPTTLTPTTKYDFATDAATNIAPYYRVIDDTSTAANLKSYGFVVGGYNSPAALTKSDAIGRYEYDTETSSELTSRAAFRSSASSQITNVSSEFGYRHGGQGVSNVNITSLERLDYSVDGTSSIIGNVTVSHQRGLVAQNGDYGWIRGGANPPAVGTPGIMLCTIVRFDFSTETESNPGQPSPVDRGSCQHGGISAGTALRQIGKNNRNDSRAGLDNQGRNVSAAYGYFIGGENNASYLTRNDRVDMLNETVSQVTNAPPGSKVACVSASGQRGYHIMGENPGGSSSNITRIDLTNETFYDAGTNFPVASTSAKPYVKSTSYAYINRGASAVETLDFETETFKPEQFHNVQSRSNSMNASTPQYGYVAGGTVSDIERLDFVSESRTTLDANLPAALNLGSGINQTRNGDVYFIGGDNAAGSQVSRFSIATETISNPGNPITKYHALGGATQNENYGYLAAGFPFPSSPGGMSTMARIEFENDTTSNPGNFLTQSRYSIGSLSNGF